jgi:hypothetical protein
MLLDILLARDVKVELFEQATLEALQDELQAWLSSRTEERVVGMSFEAGDVDSAASYRAHVLYTE